MFRVGTSKTGMYWVAGGDDGGGRRSKSTRKRSNTRQNDGVPPAAPAGILKRSGRPCALPFQFEEGMVPQEMAAAVPMPSEQNVNAMFSEMVVSHTLTYVAIIIIACSDVLCIHIHMQDELGLSRELMFKLPLQKRWELYLSKQKV